MNMSMKSRRVRTSAVALALAGIVVGGCEHGGAITGGAIGGAVGAGVGALSGDKNRGRNMAIGAAVGIGVGALVGHMFDVKGRQAKEAEKKEAERRYQEHVRRNPPPPNASPDNRPVYVPVKNADTGQTSMVKVDQTTGKASTASDGAFDPTKEQLAMMEKDAAEKKATKINNQDSIFLPPDAGQPAGTADPALQ